MMKETILQSVIWCLELEFSFLFGCGAKSFASWHIIGSLWLVKISFLPANIFKWNRSVRTHLLTKKGKTENISLIMVVVAYYPVVGTTSSCDMTQLEASGGLYWHELMMKGWVVFVVFLDASVISHAQKHTRTQSNKHKHTQHTQTHKSINTHKLYHYNQLNVGIWQVLRIQVDGPFKKGWVVFVHRL